MQRIIKHPIFPSAKEYKKNLNSCRTKKIYYTIEEAKEYIKHTAEKAFLALDFYTCPICSFFHLTSQHSKNLTEAKEYHKNNWHGFQDCEMSERIICRPQKRHKAVYFHKLKKCGL